MTDDIVTRLSTEEMTKAYYKAFPTVVTLQDAMRQALEAANEIERLRELADNLYKTLLYYPCQCGISPCKCGYDDMMDEYKEVRGE